MRACDARCASLACGTKGTRGFWMTAEVTPGTGGAERSLVRLGARFSFPSGPGGITFRLPLTTLPTVEPVRPFAPVAAFAVRNVRSTLPASELTVSAVDVDVVVLVPAAWPNNRLLLLGGADGSRVDAELACEVWPDIVRLWPPTIGLRGSSATAASELE